MNIMTYKKCAENLQNITGVSSETNMNLLKTRKFLCAGSPLTNYGTNICTVSTILIIQLIYFDCSLEMAFQKYVDLMFKRI